LGDQYRALTVRIRRSNETNEGEGVVPIKKKKKKKKSRRE